MIWIRRLLALPLSFFFILFFILAIVLTRAVDTVGDPEFYIAQLKKANVYHFFYDELLPVVIRDVRGVFPQEMGLREEKMVSIVKNIVPPRWVQTESERAIRVFGNYFLGRTHTIRYQLDLKTKIVELWKNTRKECLETSSDEFYDLVVRLFSLNLKQEQPLFSTTEPQKIEQMIRTAFPKERVISWIQTNMDSFLPYLLKEKEQFKLDFPLQESLKSVLFSLQELNRQGQLHPQEIVSDWMMRPLEGELVLPYGIKLSQQEASLLFQKAMPDSLAQKCFEVFLEKLGTLLQGGPVPEEIALDLDLRETRARMAEIAVGEVEQYLQAIFQQLPFCSEEEFESELRQLSPGQLPARRVENIDYEKFKEKINPAPREGVREWIEKSVPERFQRTIVLEGEQKESLIRLQDLGSKGIVYTQADLDPRMTDEMDKLRNLVANDMTITEEDLHQKMGLKEIQNFEEARQVIFSFTMFWWMAWIPPLVLLFLIGLLVSREWKHKWMSMFAALLVFSFLVFATNHVLYAGVVRPLIKANPAFPLQRNPIENLFNAKANEIWENGVANFFGGTDNLMLFFIFLSVAGMVFTAMMFREKAGLEEEMEKF